MHRTCSRRSAPARLALLALGVALVGCAPQVDADPSETTLLPPPTAEFDPANRVIPFPDNLLLDAVTGKVALPPQCGETPALAAIRALVLNQLDGFGTSRLAITTSFTDPVDPTTLDGRVFLLRASTAGAPADPAEPAVPIEVAVVQGQRDGADCTTRFPSQQIAIVPKVPLAARSTYVVALLSGIKATGGAEFQPSVTWALIRQPSPPVDLLPDGGLAKNDTPLDPSKPADLTSIVGLGRLWRARAETLAFVDSALPARVNVASWSRQHVLLAWDFNTESIGSCFDSSVTASPAANLASTPDTWTLVKQIAGDPAVNALFETTLGAGACQVLPCSSVQAVEYGQYVSPAFQSGASCDPHAPSAAGPFSDPVRPVKVCDNPITFVAIIPKQGAGPSGFKTVVFGHGLSRSKEDLFAIGGQLAKLGVVSVAIDAVLHGERAVPIRGAVGSEGVGADDAAADPGAVGNGDAAVDGGCLSPGNGNSCTGMLLPSCAPQCYVPILSPDLATTRDNLRQTILDTLKLERVLAACQAQGTCPNLWVDPGQIGYVGQSLGGILGSITAAVSPTMKRASLNGAAGDWMGILFFTASAQIRCPLVDALIDAGVLSGAKWNRGTDPNALCLSTDASFRQDLGFQRFAALARWILDPVDGENYASAFSAQGRAALLQEIIQDPVIPNEATDSYGALLGVAPTPAAAATSAMPGPTPNVVMPGSQWVRYSTLAPEPTTGFPGNAYGHGSLLAPAGNDPSGQLGTAQMQTDSFTFLETHP